MSFGGWPTNCRLQTVSSGTMDANRLKTQVMAVSGKTFAGTETLQCQIFELLADGCTRRHRETVSCPYKLAEVIRRLQESKVEPTKMVFEEALKIVRSESKLGRTFSDSRVGRRVYSSTWSGMETTLENKTHGDGTCDTEDWNSSPHGR